MRIWRLTSAVMCVALVSACNTDAGPGYQPDRVLLQPDRVTIFMNDGWPCVGFSTPENQTEGGWDGMLEGCPSPLPYKVAIEGEPPQKVELLPGGARGTHVRIHGSGRSWVYAAP